MRISETSGRTTSGRLRSGRFEGLCCRLCQTTLNGSRYSTFAVIISTSYTPSISPTGTRLTAVFGTGWYWQYKADRREELTQQLSIRDRTTQKLLALAHLLQTGAACSSPEGTVDVRALVSDLNEFERQLAKVEGRPPRTDLYNVLIRPCPPVLSVH